MGDHSVSRLGLSWIRVRAIPRKDRAVLPLGEKYIVDLPHLEAAMNDPRIEAIVKERVELWRKWANLGQPKDRNNPIHAQQIGWSQCADELESLIPALSEIVRQAHAEAIESINDCIDRFIRLNGEWLISPKKMQERISSMTPTLARLEAELRIAEGALAEWCEHLVPTKCQEECLYCQRLDKLRHAIANLKVQIAAEKGK